MQKKTVLHRFKSELSIEELEKNPKVNFKKKGKKDFSNESLHLNRENNLLEIDMGVGISKRIKFTLIQHNDEYSIEYSKIKTLTLVLIITPVLYLPVLALMAVFYMQGKKTDFFIWGNLVLLTPLLIALVNGDGGAKKTTEILHSYMINEKT